MFNKLVCKFRKKGHKFAVHNGECIKCGTPDKNWFGAEVAAAVTEVDDIDIRIDMDVLERVKDKITKVNCATMRESYQRGVNRIIRDQLMYLSDGASDIQELIQEIYAAELSAEDVPTIERLEEVVDAELAGQKPDDEYEF